MSENEQSADGIHWSPAEPLGWQEEHNLLERFIFRVRRIPHCNDEAQRRLVASLAELPWAGPLQRRCVARREPKPDGGMWGRCELRAGHEGDHALERGFDTPRWSTEWSDTVTEGDGDHRVRPGTPEDG